MAIKRIWHGWTTPENANEYQSVVREIVEPGIAEFFPSGYSGMELLRRKPVKSEEGSSEVEFITILTFDSLDTLIAVQGEDYTKAHVPEVAQKYLKRWDKHAVHYEVLD